jgi:phospholipid/cholesterol/gamma-HCH transport system ATP-binding protein
MATAETTTPLLSIDRVSVTFGRQEVLRDVSLDIPTGQTVAIIGESGCGKTVLLKTIVGLVTPTAGEVRFDHQIIGQLGDKALTHLRTRFGFVFQSAALFDSMSIADNVAFPLIEHQRIPRQEAYRMVAEQLAEVGLPTAVMAKKPAQLSGGMRKRVGLARALIMGPELLLYDEPTTGLDPIMSDVINELILRTRTQHKVTSVMVTHDMHSAMKVADRIVMLYPLARLDPEEPQILFDGPPHELEKTTDPRVHQFIHGEAGERIDELKGLPSP